MLASKLAARCSLLLACGILLVLAPHARSQGPSPAPYPQDKLLNELIATHPYGIPGAMACTDDGHWLLVAEGGSALPDLFS